MTETRKIDDPGMNLGLSRALVALYFAIQAHAGQLDKGGQPYLFHLLRVAAPLLPDVSAFVVAILHDVEEDTRFTLADLQPLLGDPSESDALALLRRDPDQSYQTYIEVLARDPLARRVKLADLDDNLRPDRLSAAQNAGHDVTSLVERYQRALAVLRAASGSAS